jgi:WD40 repeat protein
MGGEWSPDGTRILTIGWDDRTIRIWDGSTGTGLLVITGHHSQVMGAGGAWSPDGKAVATASHDGTAKIWDASASSPTYGQVIWELFPEGSALPVNGVAWSPDGKRIATSTADGIGQVWDARTGEQLASLAGLPGGCAIIEWSNTGDRILISYFASGIAIVWDVATPLGMDSAAGSSGDRTAGTELVRYDVGYHSGAHWSPDGKRVAISSNDGALRVFPAWQTAQELIDYAREHCVVRELTDAEREQFGLGPR